MFVASELMIMNLSLGEFLFDFVRIGLRLMLLEAIAALVSLSLFLLYFQTQVQLQPAVSGWLLGLLRSVVSVVGAAGQ